MAKTIKIEVRTAEEVEHLRQEKSSELSRKLKEEQFKRATKSQCPYCEGEGLEYLGGTASLGVAEHTAQCNGCGQKWTEVYGLLAVRELTNG